MLTYSGAIIGDMIMWFQPQSQGQMFSPWLKVWKRFIKKWRRSRTNKTNFTQFNSLRGHNSTQDHAILTKSTEAQVYIMDINIWKFEKDSFNNDKDESRTKKKRTDRRTDGRTDGQPDSSIPPLNFVLGGIKSKHSIFEKGEIIQEPVKIEFWFLRATHHLLMGNISTK